MSKSTKPELKQNNHKPDLKKASDKVGWGPGAALGWGLGVFIGAQIVTAIIISVIASFSDLPFENFLDENVVMLSFIGGVSLGLLTALLIKSVTNKYGGLKKIGLTRFDLKYLPKVLMAFGFYFLLSIGLFTLTGILFPDVDLEQEQELGFDQAVQAYEYVLAFIALVIIAPIAEEMLFRGYTFRGLARDMNWIPAAIISSALFGLAHFQLNVGIDTFALGIAAAWLVKETGNLWPAILLHGIKNLLAYILVFTDIINL